MGAPQFKISQDSEGIFRIDGELTIHDIENLKSFLDNHLARAKKISLDFGKVSYADTASLQLLIAFRKALKAEIEWEITELSPEMVMILNVSGLKEALV
ncbi:MAG: STAS domain-containing protein [Thermodesulfobacteriota bacterium]|nr:STAS domain-containing protein [Thermodesulfobacteriota bacterium]